MIVSKYRTVFCRDYDMNWYSCINQTHIRIGEFKSGTTRGPDQEYRSGTVPFRREVPIRSFDPVLSLTGLSRRDPDREFRSGTVPSTRERRKAPIGNFTRIFQTRPRSGTVPYTQELPMRDLW